ncbi:hypothetical protein ACN47A_19115 [Myxococcus fulvus]|uniref:hypothetical protein n=1 Tax=Myxococcus fulvus TaxID=33 RepID=UPI003B9D354E
MHRALAGLVLLLAGCARNVRPPEQAEATQAAPPPVEPEQPRYEHIFLMSPERALAEAAKLLKNEGWVLQPMEDPRLLLTEWRAAQIGTKSWGYQSDGDHTRYLVSSESLSERECIIRIFRMKRVAFSNDVEIKPEASGAISNRFVGMKRFEDEFRARGAPVELAQRERDTAAWVELNGATQGTRDLELERQLTLILESRPSLETLTGSLKLSRDDSFARDPAFYLRRWKEPVQEPCERKVPGFQPLLKAGLTVLIGEQLGTREAPTSVGDLMCEASQAGHAVTLALTLPDKEQARVDAYLASAGKPSDQDALLGGHFWRKVQQDGRGSRAMMDLLDRARALKAQGRAISVVAMDTDMSQGKARDAHMAGKVLKPRAARPQDVFLVLAGNAHTRLADADWNDDFVPLSRHVVEKHPDVKVLEVGYAQGRRWGCDVELNGDITCNVMGITPGPVVEIRPQTPVGVRMLPKVHSEGFHGFLDVGALSASLPAIALRGHEPEAPAAEPAKPQAPTPAASGEATTPRSAP